MYIPIPRCSAVSLMTAAMLSACGGGGGGSSTAANERITAVAGAALDLRDASTAEKTVADATTAIDNLRNASNTASNLSPLSAALAAEKENAAAVNYGQIGRLLAVMVKQKADSGKVLRAAQTETQGCNQGGSITVTASRPMTQYLNAGDEFTISANQCTENIDGVILWLNGILKMSVLQGSWVSSLQNITVGYEMLPLRMRLTSGGGETIETAMDGGFKLEFLSDKQYKMSSSATISTLSSLVITGKEKFTETISDFSYDFDYSGLQTYSGQVSILGQGTVNTTKTFITPAQYSWKTTGSPLVLDVNGQVIGGTIVISTKASPATLRLKFGQSCETPVTGNNCVDYESSTDGVIFQRVKRYAWDEFAKL